MRCVIVPQQWWAVRFKVTPTSMSRPKFPRKIQLLKAAVMLSTPPVSGLNVVDVLFDRSLYALLWFSLTLLYNLINK